MSATVTRDLATGAAAGTTRRRHSIPLAIRLGIGLDRSMWPTDRAIAEFRWAALTLGLMLALAATAHLLADPTGRYGRAVVVSGMAFAIVGLLAWSPVAPRLTANRLVRRAIGPIVLLVALAAAGLSDPAVLDSQIGTPFVILAFTYAALTPGFSIAALIAVAVGTSLMVQHAGIPGHSTFDPHAVDFLVRATVAFLAGVAMHEVDRGLRRERRRAERLAARKGAHADQLEGLQRIVRRFDGSKPVAEVMQAVVEDVASDVRRHARVRLPAGRDRPAVDGRRGRLRQPVPRHRARRRHHRPQRRLPRDGLLGRRPQRPGLPRRAAGRPQRGRGPGAARR